MTRLELNWFHTKLLETKNREKEAHDKAMAEVNQKRNHSSNSNPRIRKPRTRRHRR